MTVMRRRRTSLSIEPAAGPPSVPQSSPIRLRSFAFTAAMNCESDSFIDCGTGVCGPRFPLQAVRAASRTRRASRRFTRQDLWSG